MPKEAANRMHNSANKVCLMMEKDGRYYKDICGDIIFSIKEN